MRIRLLAATILFAIPASPQARSAPPPPAAKVALPGLHASIQRIRSTFPGDMAVYMRNLATGDELALDADSVYETFSVIKLAIAAEVLHQAQTGKLSLSERLPLKAADQRLPSGVLYVMDPGLQPTIKDLLTLMIIISDNEATDVLADRVGRGNVTRYAHSLGLGKTEIRFSDLGWDRTWLGTLDPTYRHASGDQTVRFPFDNYSGEQVERAFGHTIYGAGIFFGHSSARDIGRLLQMAVENKLVSATASKLLLDTMARQQVNDRFPKYLQDIRVAHKTGDGQPFIANDAGVLWVNHQPIVLVVFTGHHRGPTPPLHDAIARVAALVVHHYGGKTSLDLKP
jgi:beta-lactamase class A